MRGELTALLAELAARLDRVEDLVRTAGAGRGGPALTPELAHYRHRIADAMREVAGAEGPALGGLAEVTRALFGLVAGVEGAVEWHSPVRARSGGGGVGLLPVTGAHDYQRDRCPVVRAYEQAWVATCVDRPRDGAPVRALAFAGGMAALSTVLAWLAHDLGERDERDGRRGTDRAAVLVPRSTYHETRLLLARGPLAARVRWVDGVARRDLAQAVARHRPAVVVLDVQANGPSLELADVAALLAALAREADPSRPTTVVFDTTMLGIRAQPFAAAAADHPALRLVTVQSLTKFAQLGLDRVAGGLVVAHDAVVDGLDDWREHLGTNASAAAIRQLPSPSRARQEERWQRHERSATVLAAALADGLRGRAAAVVHPGLPGHVSARLARRIGTAGATVAVAGAAVSALEDAVARAVLAARAGDLPLAEGTSFGFDATRLSVVDPIGAAPFLRVAPGAGPPDEAAAVGAVLAEVLRQAVGRA